MTDESDASRPVGPNAAMIGIFAKTLFDRCDGWVAVRQLPEKGGGNRVLKTSFLAPDSNLAGKLAAEADTAAKAGRALCVVAGTVSAPGKARAGDVVATQVVLVDLDHGDIATKRQHLVHHFGPPSLAVESGGITVEGQHKLHLYWKLAEPARGAAIATVCRLRGAIAAKVGGDRSFQSAHQSIRVAGSVYRKGGVQRLTTIHSQGPTEYALAELADAVMAMPPLETETISDSEPNYGRAPKAAVTTLLVQRVREGGIDGTTRFEALSRVIGHWIRRTREGQVSWEKAWEEIVAYNAARIEPPWPPEQLKYEVEQLWRLDAERNSGGEGSIAGGGNGGHASVPAPFTEDALALEFTNRFGADWSYVAAWGQWLTWSGARWEPEKTLRAFDLARIVCRY